MGNFHTKKNETFIQVDLQLFFFFTDGTVITRYRERNAKNASHPTRASKGTRVPTVLQRLVQNAEISSFCFGITLKCFVFSVRVN